MRIGYLLGFFFCMGIQASHTARSALATLDDKLKTAAQTVGVLLFGVH